MVKKWKTKNNTRIVRITNYVTIIVDFTDILRAAFAPIFVEKLQSQTRVDKSCNEHVHTKKAALKMLVKFKHRAGRPK